MWFIKPLLHGAGIIVLLFSCAGLLAKFEISEKILEKIENKYGADGRFRVEEWRVFIANNQSGSDMEKLKLVNQFFNRRIKFVDDILHWKKKDYWATPFESLGTGGGDCEDFSIAKYVTLKEIGMDESKLRITYVKALELNQAHMVLTYFSKPSAIPLVLDNLIPEIKSASKRKDLAPVYSFNGAGLWLAKERGRGRKVGGSDRLSLWKELQIRLSDEIK
ncbi:MAG: sulfate adenylyltransferase [Gammaproteobacteria bacterium]|nr:sulfate adenylyltransferase [Gammaproteobacteria bacterium]